MGQKRGSAKQVMALGMALLCVLALVQSTLGAKYYVGGTSGWSFASLKWAKGKTLRDGDLLVFKYAKGAHNVVAVGPSGYNRCTIPKRPKMYQSGNDIIKVKKGMNFFICSIATHCKSGMKIAIKAL